MRAMRTRCEDELLDAYIRTGNEAADFFSTAVWLQRSRSEDGQTEESCDRKMGGYHQDRQSR